jgi:hypothetical protein
MIELITLQPRQDRLRESKCTLSRYDAIGQLYSLADKAEHSQVLPRDRTFILAR